MSYRFDAKEQPTRSVLSIRTRTSAKDLPQRLREGYGAIAQYLEEVGEKPVGPPFAAYFNMDMEDLDVEMGFPVSREFPGSDDITAGEIPGGKFAACFYTGPYSGVKLAYTALSQWMEDNGYEPTGVAYEMYLDDPAQTPPQDLRTQIMFPLK
jgi:effector-binding domain-containing protein